MKKNSKTNEILICGLLAVGVLLTTSRNGKADFFFGAPENLGPTVNSSSIETEPSISSDGLELFFNSSRPGGYGRWDLWVSSRATTDDDWDTPVNLGPIVNSSQYDLAACISSDGLSLYFCSDRSSGWDIWVTSRAATDQPWETPVKLGPPVNSSSMDVGHISPNGLELYIGSDRPGGYGDVDLWVSTRSATDDDWGTPVNLGATVNAASGEIYSSISTDGLMLFFSGGDSPPRIGGYGQADIWMTKRKTRDDDWGTPTNLGPNVNSSSIDRAPSISADGSILYFCSDRSGGNDIWQVPILPIVDFNADGIVDAEDMCIIVDNWGTDNQLCDIGPMPWGDGIVDVHDLIVLSEHLFEDYLAMPHWKLDEEAGNIAYDNPGVHHGKLHGGPVWQPTEGKIDGALQFDGTDDYISTGFILDPSSGPFSVFGWVKGGAPGQVIITQLNGTIWLGLDVQSGAVMSGLKPPSSGWVQKKPLVSESTISDGTWHHVGFVWDGSYRILYVDGIEVAKDTSAQNPLISADGGLHIGANQALSASSFFSGLIDDIHIYDFALTAEEISALAQ